MTRYFIKLSYSGTRYNGWQSQPHIGTITVQETVEKAMFTFFRIPISLVGCGRTDTGVHAIDYIAHFDIDDIKDIPSSVYRLNKLLPDDISIQDIIQVHSDAHARFDATSRSYQYHLHIKKSPFLHHSYYYPYKQPDIDTLNQAAAVLLKYDDFNTFCKFHADNMTTLCAISKSHWEKNGDQYVYHISANRFLRGMIRLIVGMCLNVDRGKLSIEEVEEALKAKSRTGHDWSVPAEGLVLCDIKYPYI